jgi:hypothetical protein
MIIKTESSYKSYKKCQASVLGLKRAAGVKALKVRIAEFG